MTHEQQIANGIEARSPKGDPYTIYEGLNGVPCIDRRQEGGKISYEAPEGPHVFTADGLYVYDKAGNTILSLGQARVLYLHGFVHNGQWLPVDHKLQQQGVTVEDIVKNYESHGSFIDVLFVCRHGANLAGASVGDGDLLGNKIRPLYGGANGNVIESNGAVTVNLCGDIDIKGWENHKKVEEIELQPLGHNAVAGADIEISYADLYSK
jgi:hypothetical protein